MQKVVNFEKGNDMGIHCILNLKQNKENFRLSVPGTDTSLVAVEYQKPVIGNLLAVHKFAHRGERQRWLLYIFNFHLIKSYLKVSR